MGIRQSGISNNIGEEEKGRVENTRTKKGLLFIYCFTTTKTQNTYNIVNTRNYKSDAKPKLFNDWSFSNRASIYYTYIYMSKRQMYFSK